MDYGMIYRKQRGLSTKLARLTSVADWTDAWWCVSGAVHYVVWARADAARWTESTAAVDRPCKELVRSNQGRPRKI